MIITLKGADFSQNNIGRIVDYSEAKTFLTAHYPSHKDNASAEALQVLWNTLGKGVTDSVYERLRWLILPVFGNSVTEDAYDAKNENQLTITTPASLSHLRRGLVFAGTGNAATGMNTPYDDNDGLGSLFYLTEASTNEYRGNGGKGGSLKCTSAPVDTDSFSKTSGGSAVSTISVDAGRILMFYELGNNVDDICKFRSENGITTLYRLAAVTGTTTRFNKILSRVCSHATTSSEATVNTSNPVMMVGSVKNMTDEDAAIIISAIQTFCSSLNV